MISTMIANTMLPAAPAVNPLFLLLVIGVVLAILFWPTIVQFLRQQDAAIQSPAAPPAAPTSPIAATDSISLTPIRRPTPQDEGSRTAFAAAETLYQHMLDRGVDVEEADKLLKPIYPHLLRPKRSGATP